MPVSEVVPEFDGELAGDMDIHAATSRIVLNKIRKVGRDRCNLTEAFKQVFLFPPPERSQNSKTSISMSRRASLIWLHR
ncbi:MAG: hypothetical protein WDN00_06190 [Limisphaerales bacterium]